MAQRESILSFFLSSPNRTTLLEKIIEVEGGTENPRKKALIHFCRTRWSQRGKTFERFVVAYPYLFKALSAIKGTEPCPEGFIVSYIDKIKSKALGLKRLLSTALLLLESTSCMCIQEH